MNYQEYISINSDVRFGKPCIINTRITVYDVLGWLASGMTNDEIVKDFPQVSNNSIIACLAYAADREHKLKIVK